MLTIIAAVVVFVLAWLFVQYVPLPESFPPKARQFGYALVILIAILWVWYTYLR